MHKKAKDLNDESEADRIYGIYQKSLISSKEKEEKFKSKFGSSFMDDSPIKSSGENPEAGEGTDASQELYLNLPIKEFTSKIKSLSVKERKSLLSRLVKERNERYVAMDIEQDSLIKQLESKKLTPFFGKDI